MIITIDGPAGSGKSTLAKRLAQKLRFDYLDTGAHYRAVTYWLVCKQGDLTTFHFEIIHTGGGKHYIVGGEDVTNKIRTPEVAAHVSAISKRPDVRSLLTEWQREYAKNRDVVLDGRDAGSVIFPQATCKFFLIASSRVRAERRYRELIKKKVIDPKRVSLDAVEQELLQRDRIDASREIAPLVKPIGAIEIDTSHHTIRGVERILWKTLRKLHVYPYRSWKAKFFGEGYARCHSFYLFAKLFVDVFLKIFYRFQFHGQENIPAGKGIIAPNHVSFFDPPIAAAAFSEGLFYLAQDYLFRVPLLGFLITRLNALSVKGDVTDRSAFEGAITILEEERKVMIFPEGERSWDGKLFPFKRGVALLSILTNAPLIPVYIDGSYQVWKRGQWVPKPWGRFIVRIGKPISPKEFAHIEGKKERQKALLEALKTSIERLHRGEAP